MSAPVSVTHREPTQDERDGMTWWNGLTVADRRVWLTRCNGTSAAEAWACYKTYAPQFVDLDSPPRDLKILREYRASEQRVLAEAETPVGDLRNALQVITMYRPRFEIGMWGTGDHPVDILDALKKRIESALDKIENDPIAKLARELDTHPMAFVLRVHGIERRLSAIENMLDDKPHLRGLGGAEQP